MARSFLTPVLALFLAISGLAMPVSIPSAHAQAEAQKPLLIVRFNQRSVYFQNSLTMAVSRAESIKPDVVYNVISYVPDGASQQEAQSNVNAIVSSMLNMGVPQSRIQVARQTVAPNYPQEVHISVQ